MLSDDQIKRNAEMIARLHEREMRKRPYVQLPYGHPHFDAEDIPNRWTRWAVEVLAAAFLGGMVLAVAVYAHTAMPNPLTDWLNSLTQWVQSWR